MRGPDHTANAKPGEIMLTASIPERIKLIAFLLPLFPNNSQSS